MISEWILVLTALKLDIHQKYLIQMGPNHLSNLAKIFDNIKYGKQFDNSYLYVYIKTNTYIYILT